MPVVEFWARECEFTHDWGQLQLQCPMGGCDGRVDMSSTINWEKRKKLLMDHFVGVHQKRVKIWGSMSDVINHDSDSD